MRDGNTKPIFTTLRRNVVPLLKNHFQGDTLFNEGNMDE